MGGTRPTSGAADREGNVMHFALYALTGALASLVLSPASWAQNADWSGFYAGLAFGDNNGDQDYDASDDYALEGQTYGAFAGYNWSAGRFVYGGEIALLKGSVYETALDNSQGYQDEYNYEQFIDLKARFGYAAGNALLYATFGYSFADYLSIPDRYDLEGAIYGVGIDYRFADGVFIGAELLARNYDIPLDEAESSFNTLSIRAGMSFPRQGAFASAAQSDWSGFYAGLTAGIADGEQDYDFDGDADYNLEGRPLGLFAGYDQVAGQLLYGGEIALIRGDVYEVEFGGTAYPGEYEYQNFVDFKARVGYPLGSALLYGTFGYSFTEFFSLPTSYDTGGAIYGLGIDYQIAGRYFVGAEYLHREYTIPIDAFDSSIDTLSLRAGMRF
jgi:hypothetical protein